MGYKESHEVSSCVVSSVSDSSSVDATSSPSSTVISTVSDAVTLTVCNSKNAIVGASFIKGDHDCFFIAFCYSIIVQVPPNDIGFCTACYIRFKLKRSWDGSFCVT